MVDGHNIIGKKYGRLTIIEDLGRYKKEGTKDAQHYVRCICDCGREKNVILKNLKKGTTTSCGCYFKEIMVKRNISNRILNEYYIFNDIVFVKFSNCNEYFICDLDDWERLKQYTWSSNDSGYAKTTIYGKVFTFHKLVVDCPMNKVVDHIFQVSNGVCDNRKSNLRVVSFTINARNFVQNKNNKSGVTGVFWLEKNKKWMVRITADYKMIYLGLFDKKEDAISARKQGELEYWGDVR